MAICTAIVTVAVLVLSSFRFFVHFYPIELFNHFQLQYFLASVVSLLLVAALRRWRIVALACATCVVSGTAVIPFYFDARVSDADELIHQRTGTVRLIHANVHSSNKQYSSLLDLIAKVRPDLILLQEVNNDWLEALEPLAGDYPFSFISAREDNFGLAVYSRLPLHDAVVRQFGSAFLPSMVFQIELENDLVDVITTHPIPPTSAAAQSSRDEQLMQIASFAKGRGNPLIIVGDLNTTMWTGSYRNLCRKLGLINARDGFGIMPSWPANLPAIMRIPIDHCLVSDELLVRDCRLGPRIGSDHLPLIVDLQIRK